MAKKELFDPQVYPELRPGCHVYIANNRTYSEYPLILGVRKSDNEIIIASKHILAAPCDRSLITLSGERDTKLLEKLLKRYLECYPDSLVE